MRPTYQQIIDLVEGCQQRRNAAGESNRMMAKWISEGLNALMHNPSPSPNLEGLTDEQRGVGIGMAIAASIIMKSWGNDTYAREILGAAGLDTLDKLKASGVDQYDIDALMPVVATEGQP
jgi:hypothetical protein